MALLAVSCIVIPFVAVSVLPDGLVLLLNSLYPHVLMVSVKVHS